MAGDMCQRHKARRYVLNGLRHHHCKGSKVLEQVEEYDKRRGVESGAKSLKTAAIPTLLIQSIEITEIHGSKIKDILMSTAHKGVQEGCTEVPHTDRNKDKSRAQTV